MDSNDYTFLRLKNPNNKATKEDLCRVIHFLQEIVGFSKIPYMWYEKGEQNQQHIHAVIKKKMPTSDALAKMSKTFKQKKLKYFKYEHAGDFETINYPGEYSEIEIKLDQFNWHLSPFNSLSHLDQVIHEYRHKTLDPQFVD